MKKLSELIREGMAVTGPAYREYVVEGNDGRLCTCALGAAGYAELGLTGTEADIGEAASQIYYNLTSRDYGLALLLAAGWKRKNCPEVGIGQAVGILNDHMIRESGEEGFDPRPRIVELLEGLEL